jgi:UPF0755 protein
MKLRLVAVVLVVVLALAAGAVVWLWRSLSLPVTLEGEAFVVAEGMSGREALTELERRGLLRSALAGRIYLRFAADGRWIHYGHYRFPRGSRPVDILERLLDGRVEMVTVTVVEGSDSTAVGAVMSAAGIGDEAGWAAAATRTEWITDLAPEASSLEGFFFPDTYQFAVGIGVEDAARHLVERFRTVWAESVAGESPALVSVYETVILASLVEAETPLEGERAKVAGVFANRLDRGMLLQCDPTVVFALKRRGEWTGRLLRVHWQVDDPYNTYRYPGLPPGPINSPGRAALRAAIDPMEHEFFYFVASPEGGHTFSRTLGAHNRAVAVWQRSRR